MATEGDDMRLQAALLLVADEFEQGAERADVFGGGDLASDGRLVKPTSPIAIGPDRCLGL